MGNIYTDIQQTAFASTTEKSIVNVLYTANWLRDKKAPIFKKVGLQAQHFNILKIVKGKYPEAISPGEILKVMLDKGRDLTRLVDKLVKMELLERTNCPDNRRKVNIKVTEKGIQQTKELEIEIKKLFDTFGGLNSEEAEQLSILLDKMRR